MKKSCVIYDSWADQIINLPDELAGQFAKMLLQYAIYGEVMKSDNPAINAMIVPVMKKLDEDAEAWEEVKRQRSEAGKKGMANRWHNKAITDDNTVITNDNSDKQGITNITVSDSVSVSVKKKKNTKKKIHDFPERDYDYDALTKELIEQ